MNILNRILSPAEETCTLITTFEDTVTDTNANSTSTATNIVANQNFNDPNEEEIIIIDDTDDEVISSSPTSTSENLNEKNYCLDHNPVSHEVDQVLEHIISRIN